MAVKPAETSETLQRLAEHARWLANGSLGDEAAYRLLAHARELEIRAGDIDDGRSASVTIGVIRSGSARPRDRIT